MYLNVTAFCCNVVWKISTPAAMESTVRPMESKNVYIYTWYTLLATQCEDVCFKIYNCIVMAKTP